MSISPKSRIHLFWSPAYVSISELFRSLSPWEVGDPVKLVCELYKIFRRETQSTETLDDFYFWGEMLISDFDDADKNRVDTDKLFSNLQDLRNIMDDYTFIDDEQEEAIRQFFQNFSIERRTALKERFISLWDVLGNIYKGFRESLASQKHCLRRNDVPPRHRASGCGQTSIREICFCRI